MLDYNYNVPLSPWMRDYVQFIADKYDLNFSAVIRIHMCLGFLYAISTVEPEFKTDLQGRELKEFMEKTVNGEFPEIECHQMLSKIVLESRKAVEYRLSKKI